MTSEGLGDDGCVSGDGLGEVFYLQVGSRKLLIYKGKHEELPIRPQS